MNNTPFTVFLRVRWLFYENIDTQGSAEKVLEKISEKFWLNIKILAIYFFNWYM
jgi:hypothetical protein